MFSLLVGVGLLPLAGLACLVLPKRGRAVSYVGPGAAVLAALLGIVPSLRAVVGANVRTVHWAWSLPYGSFALKLDALSGWFLVPVLLIGALGAVYGARYLRSSAAHRSVGPAWFFYDVLLASMILLVLAGNGVLFLVAWEVMSLASFFLVMFEDDRPEVRQAGWTYLVATHVGTAFLLAMFVLAGHRSQDLDFSRFGETAPAHAGILFVLAVIGFGTKAGFMPMHIWLPEAHPAAPSHVSAVMSGVMIKMGIYGLLRMLTFLGPPPAWWGWSLIGVGLVSGVLGVLFALAQHDLKRLLAYHSVENIGIIALGLGTGLLGLSLHSVPMAVLGFGGGLLHVLNHACFKALLFLGAGAVLHETGTREIERMGGLLKRMPWTGSAFIVGAAAICGLPPLNGFVSELLVYLAALEGVRFASAWNLPVLIAVVAGLALIGGLALACFAKAVGTVFLGEPRSPEVARGHECGGLMVVPMLILAAGCAAIGLLGPVVVSGLVPAIATVTGMPVERVGGATAGPCQILWAVVAVSVLLLLLVGGLVLFRRRLLATRTVSHAVTWDCGYAQPTARMQYTASSFAQPLTSVFRVFLRTRAHVAPPVGLFPESASLATHTDDVCKQGMYVPVFGGVARVLARLRWLQHGHVQAYVSYIALALLAVLVWKLW